MILQRIIQIILLGCILQYDIIVVNSSTSIYDDKIKTFQSLQYQAPIH